MADAPNAQTFWRWATIFLAGVVVSVVSFWLIEAQHYVNRSEVEQIVERGVGREEIMAELARIYQTSSEARGRLRNLEEAVARLETVLEEARR